MTEIIGKFAEIYKKVNFKKEREIQSRVKSFLTNKMNMAIVA